MKVKKGFTLIELLVVIAIIAMLLSILMPSLSMAKEIARRVVCSTQLKALGLGVMGYANENDDELPFSLYMQTQFSNPGVLYNPTAASTPFYSFRAFQVNLGAAPSVGFPDNLKRHTRDIGGWPTNGSYAIFGYGWLYYNDFIETGKAFYCPSTDSSNPSLTYEGHSEVRPWPWVTE
ncbi:type II secretion system protein, partial [Candidatus Pacearchaeota archaeon]|nr:type II secretion system protein [Candidatus Pacearchaeota archaeon]